MQLARKANFSLCIGSLFPSLASPNFALLFTIIYLQFAELNAKFQFALCRVAPPKLSLHFSSLSVSIFVSRISMSISFSFPFAFHVYFYSNFYLTYFSFSLSFPFFLSISLTAAHSERANQIAVPIFAFSALFSSISPETY